MSIEQETIGVGEVDTYRVDWTDWLAGKAAEEGEPVSIASATWSVVGKLVVKSSPAPEVFDSARQARVWIDATAMQPNEQATLTCSITSTAGHIRKTSARFVAAAR